MNSVPMPMAPASKMFSANSAMRIIMPPASPTLHAFTDSSRRT